MVLNALSPAGAEMVSFIEGQELQKQGWQVGYVGLRSSDPHFKREIQSHFDFVVDLDYASLRRPSALISALRQLKTAIETFKPNIVHSHCELPDILTLFAPRSKVVEKKIRTSHNERYFGLNYGWMIERTVSLFFNRVIVISSEIEKRHQQSKTVRLLNCLRVEASGGRAYPRRKAIEGSIQVGIVGRLTSQKGQLRFLQHLAANKSCADGLNIKIFGAGPDFESARANIEYNNLPVTLEGFVKNIDELFGSLDVLLITSSYEGLSSVMIEALCRGVPVFSLPVSGAQDVDAMVDYELICDGFDELLARCKNLPNIKQQTMEKIKEEFSPANHIVGLLRAYSNSDVGHEWVWK